MLQYNAKQDLILISKKIFYIFFRFGLFMASF